MLIFVKPIPLLYLFILENKKKVAWSWLQIQVDFKNIEYNASWRQHIPIKIKRR